MRITLTRGERASSFTIRPFAAAATGGVCLLLIAGYLSAAGYLMLRDDLNVRDNATRFSQTRAYEDRISQLRTRIDQITSRRLVAQQTYEQRIEDLKRRQGELDTRYNRISDVLARAAESGLTIAINTPMPLAKPTVDAAVPQPPLAESVEAMGGTVVPLDKRADALGLRGSMPPSHAADVQSFAMRRIDTALEVMDSQAKTALDLIAVSAERRIARIERATRSLGVKMKPDNDAVGGPYEPLASGDFDDRLGRAERAVDRLSVLSKSIRSLPLGQPLANLDISSNYGPRLDPFVHEPAMHTGIDFRARYGTPIRATAAGTIASAGRNGGYGLMVEIDHGNDLSTRYGHMSRIRVSDGETVRAGEVIGYVGSTGRSTGAHLHYETRMASRPVDPDTFIDAGERLRGVVN